MYINFNSSNNSSNKSSKTIFEYLSKENNSLKNKSLLFNNENFFSNDFDVEKNNGSEIEKQFCIDEIDNNLGSRHKDKESNFYILNISPSNKELEHLENKAIEVLKEKGLELKENSSHAFKKYFEEQKNVITDIFLKDYTNDIMIVYADLLNREIYKDLKNLPSERKIKELSKEINKRFQNYLLENKLDEISLGLKKESDFVGISNYKQLDKSRYEFIYNSEKYKLFLSPDKISFAENKLVVDKEYLEDSISYSLKQQEMNLVLDKYKTEFSTVWNSFKENSENNNEANKNFKYYLTENKKYEFYSKVNVKVLEDKQDKIFVLLKDNNQRELKTWINKNDIYKPENTYKSNDYLNIQVEDYKLVALQNKGTIRNDKDLELKPLNFGKIKEENSIVKVEFKINNTKDNIILSFNKNILVKQKGKYFVSNSILEKAKQTGIRSYLNNNFQDIKDQIKEKVWKENGFNPEKRKLTKDDLMYFAKIENQRTYKSSNKMDYKLIYENQQIDKKIKHILLNGNRKEIKQIENLKSKLHRDKYTGKVIFEGQTKGGRNKHVHLVVSKYDKTLSSHLKMSISPKANQKDCKMPNGKQVGFNRDNFFRKTESIFDKKFEFERNYENSYHFKNEVAKLTRIGKSLTNSLCNEIVSEIKKELKNPIHQLKQEINPINKIRQELKVLPLPTSIPKSKLDMLLKLGKLLIKSAGQGFEI
ncbi:DUF5712 family protein [Chishuiella sp.]|uniref:DUF5712 family protein n=1 Tax=Chishuiella sp. TaxID=1969467 RepID=UPI0028AEC4C1|nr:DUF5712 family protein [Chishuiella sp.]